MAQEQQMLLSANTLDWTLSCHMALWGLGSPLGFGPPCCSLTAARLTMLNNHPPMSWYRSMVCHGMLQTVGGSVLQYVGAVF